MNQLKRFHLNFHLQLVE